jgi:hypothetical protein
VGDIASAERAIVRVCRSSLDVAQLQREVLAALRRAMTIDAAFFATADPETLLFTGAHSEDPLIEMTSMFLDNELGGRDVNTFPELVRAPGHVRSLDTATRTEWMASTRYRDILRPVGLGDELRAHWSSAGTAGVMCACTARTAHSALPLPRPPCCAASDRTSRTHSVRPSFSIALRRRCGIDRVSCC